MSTTGMTGDQPDVEWEDSSVDQQAETGVPYAEGESPEVSGQRFSIGLTPFGHIGINITDANGDTAGYMITDIEEASKIVVHLFALTNMMIQNLYARAIAEQEMAKSLMNQGGGSGLWTPGS